MAIGLNSKLQKIVSNKITSLEKEYLPGWDKLSLLASSFIQSHTEQIFQNLTSKVESKLANLDRTLQSHIQTLDKLFGTNVLNIFKSDRSTQHTSTCNYSKFLLQDPYITGYFFVVFALPNTLKKQLQIDVSHTLGYLCKDVSQPTLTVNSIEQHGYGQVVCNIPTNVTYDRQITMTFYDTYHLAISQFFTTWILSMHDTRTGLPLYKDQSDFKASCLVIHFNPAFKKILINAYIGIYPSSLPQINQARDSISIKETQVTFTFDQFLFPISKT